MGESAQAPGSHDAMAGNDQRVRIRAARLTDGARGGIQFRRQFAIAARVPGRNSAYGTPYAALECRALFPQRQVETELRIIKIAIDLPADAFGQRINRRDGARTGLQKEEFLDAIAGGPDANRAKRRNVHGLPGSMLSAHAVTGLASTVRLIRTTRRSP
jgi:hypothetical protein